MAARSGAHQSSKTNHRTSPLLIADTVTGQAGFAWSAVIGPRRTFERAAPGQKRAKQNIRSNKLMNTSIPALLMTLVISSRALACSCGVQALEDHVGNADAIYFATLQQAKVIVGGYDQGHSSIEGTFLIRKTLPGADEIMRDDIQMRYLTVDGMLSGTDSIKVNVRPNSTGPCRSRHTASGSGF
jgi:hypothetical protein